MKRITDVSRARPAAAQESAETGTRPSSGAAAMERATSLLVDGLQESDIPIERLSGALTRMAETLTGIGTPLFGQAADESAAADLQVVQEVFARELAVCIESLQFHDRLMQQLIQARDILTGLRVESAAVPAAPANDSSIAGSIEIF